MTPVDLPLPRLTSYGLPAPTADDVRDALRTASPDDHDEVWGRACVHADVPRGALLLDVPQLEALADALSQVPGPVGLAGRAVAIRVASYKALAATDSRGARTGNDWARSSMERLLRSRVPTADRLADLADLDLHSGAARSTLDRAARSAAERLGTPIGLVTIVLDGAQSFAGSHGLTGWVKEAGGTPVEWSLCATIVRTGEPYVVPDAGADVLQRSNPMHVRAGLVGYAGVPLTSARGTVLGSCCVISGQPYEAGEAALAELRGIARAVAQDLEQTRRSRVG